MLRSRYVGKEFNDGPLDGLFAGTPPLEAMRALVSEAATLDGDEDKSLRKDDTMRTITISFKSSESTGHSTIPVYLVWLRSLVSF